jgi:hypothetical protein
LGLCEAVEFVVDPVENVVECVIDFAGFGHLLNFVISEYLEINQIGLTLIYAAAPSIFNTNS